MKKYVIQGCVLASIMSAVSCSTDFPNIDEGMSGNQIYEDKLYNLLEQYYLEIHPSTRASLPGFRITEVHNQSYSVAEVLESDSISLPTRAIEEQDFTVQTVCMDFGETSGYAVVSDDERLERVFFFTENGELSDTTFIRPLRDFFLSVPRIAADMIVEENNTILTRSGEVTTYVIEDVVKFKWGQGYPYNREMPACNCQAYGYHMPTGCVTTAVAQYLAKRGNFKGSYYPNDIPNFSKFPIGGQTPFFTESQARQIANYFLEIAQNCQVKFSCEGSGSHMDAVLNYLKELGINCYIPTSGWGYNEMIATLAGGIPLIVRGVNSRNMGHMWLLTGVKYRRDLTDYVGNVEYYCNWGWDGRSEGWMIGNYYTPSNMDPFSKNVRMINTISW